MEISREVYAIPLARIDQSFFVARDHIERIENRQYFHHEQQNIGLVAAWQVLELDEPKLSLQSLPVIILSDRSNRYGLVVDRFLGEKELVVQDLDPRLGKVTDILAGAVLEDGSPILILDVEDMVRSIDNLLSGGRLTKLADLKPEEKGSQRNGFWLSTIRLLSVKWNAVYLKTKVTTWRQLSTAWMDGMPFAWGIMILSSPMSTCLA